MMENIQKFISELDKSLSTETFVKLTLSNYKGPDPHLQKIMIRLIETKKGVRLFFLYRYETRDTAKNYEVSVGSKMIREMLGTEFFTAHLFTLNHDFHLDIGKKRKVRLNIGKPTFKTKPDLSHNRKKTTLISQGAFYLKALGITNEKSEIREKQQDKWKQINKFIEIVSKTFEKSPLKDRKSIKITDMGCGKGYLTFAVYDYFKNTLGIDVEVTGVEAKSNLVELCNSIAKAAEFEKLIFVNNFIGNYDLRYTDILIALHACDTATDDAIFQAIKANAEIIMVAPCCHHEIRPQVKAPEMLKNILKHGVLLEKMAETITDGLRALILEKMGYKTKVFEFISPEHTPKNNMIVAVKNHNQSQPDEIDKQIQQIKNFYGIKEQRLENLLAS
ncbi:MAG: SAM-dependent methyltransferase [Acidobacteria bacterium]|nr:MAG: SAM-dependent methyltransferase [Acidobacteriota bacterium]